MASSEKKNDGSYSHRILTYSQKRLAAFLKEIKRLQTLDFPYPSSKRALSSILDVLEPIEKVLVSLHSESDPDTVRANCVISLEKIAEFLPHVGFILRSTDVINTFEVYSPFRRICSKVLKPNVPLIMSSEWVYSPHLVARIPGLEDFVFIGLPASEAANPLLIPLAGHELGHAVWMNRIPVGQYSQKIRDEIFLFIRQHLTEYENAFGSTGARLQKEIGELDLEDLENWLPCEDWTLAHIQESFCDFVGLRLFGESYLHAFAYLLAPFPDSCSAKYPSLVRRASDLETAAHRFEINVPPGYADSFGPEPPSRTDQPKDVFRLKATNNVSASLVSELIDQVDQIIIDSNIPHSDKQEIARIYDDYKNFMVPSIQASTIASITNAGWKAFHNEQLWEEKLEKPEDRDRILQDIMLKNFEVLEVQTRLAENRDT